MKIILTPHPIEGTTYVDDYAQYGIVNYKGIALTKDLVTEVQSLKDAEYYEQILEVQNKVTNLSKALEVSLLNEIDFTGAFAYTEKSWIRDRLVHNSDSIANIAYFEKLEADGIKRQAIVDANPDATEEEKLELIKESEQEVVMEEYQAPTEEEISDINESIENEPSISTSDLLQEIDDLKTQLIYSHELRARIGMDKWRIAQDYTKESNVVICEELGLSTGGNESQIVTRLYNKLKELFPNHY